MVNDPGLSKALEGIAKRLREKARAAKERADQESNSYLKTQLRTEATLLYQIAVAIYDELLGENF